MEIHLAWTEHPDNPLIKPVFPGWPGDEIWLHYNARDRWRGGTQGQPCGELRTAKTSKKLCRSSPRFPACANGFLPM